MTGPLKLKQSALGALAIVAIAIIAMAIPQHASAVSLKPNAVITDNTIKLKDIFEGLDHKAERVLGPAPLPGRDMVLNARTLTRIAVALDLNWRPSSTADQVVLTRAATMINRDQIEDVLKNELSAQNVDGEYNIVIPENQSTMVLPYDSVPSVEVLSFDYRADKDRFEAMLVAPSKAEPLRQMKVIGSVERLARVPVLLGTFNNGSIISADDVDLIAVPERQIKDDMILKAEDLIGMTPRRVLFAGKTIKNTEIEAPRIVGRGDIITMKFESGLLSLTAEGKALEYGSKGDVIRVVNTAGSQSLRGTVTGIREVTVSSF